jgi:hypothetical protein
VTETSSEISQEIGEGTVECLDDFVPSPNCTSGVLMVGHHFYNFGTMDLTLRAFLLQFIRPKWSNQQETESILVHGRMLLLMYQQAKLSSPPSLPPTIPERSALSLAYLVLNEQTFSFSAPTKGLSRHFSDAAEEFLKDMEWEVKYGLFVELITSMLQQMHVLPVECWNF